jgi:hypothetical protein
MNLMFYRNNKHIFNRNFRLPKVVMISPFVYEQTQGVRNETEPNKQTFILMIRGGNEYLPFLFFGEKISAALFMGVCVLLKDSD